MLELDAQRRAQLAETLAKHQTEFNRTRALRDEAGPGNYVLGCKCGHEFRPHPQQANELAHLADVLAPLVAEWLAGAWDEGYLLALRDVENIAADMNADNPYRDNPSKDGED